MKCFRRPSMVLLHASLCVLPGFSAPPSVPGTVERVTLYRSQALVTRSIPVDGAKGSLEIVVTKLPEQIVANSLFAEGSEEVEVRAVRLRTRAVGEEPREEVRKLDDELQALADKMAEAEGLRALLAKRTAYLDKLDGFVAPAAKLELSKGLLDAESLKSVTLFVFEQRQEIAKAGLEIARDLRDLAKEKALLQRKRGEITGSASHTVHEAVLFLEKLNDAAGTVQLNYLAGGCGWSPSYTFRAGEDRKAVRAEYNAMIHQMTGEDWQAVELSLSTASPALAAAGPGLAPFHVGLERRAQEAQQTIHVGQGKGDLKMQLRNYQQEQVVANVLNRQTFSLSDNIKSSWSVNYAACNINLLELTGGKDLFGALELEDAGAGEAPSLSYPLPSEVSLASRSDRQMVRILQTTFESRFYHVATPVLTSYVYREAEMLNAGDQDLLAGPITVYLEGRFVGRGEIPTVARGQTFVVGFGADPQLRVRRELAAKDDKVQGGNRELSIRYRLVLENFKEQAIPVRVFDRLPHSSRAADLRIALQASAEDPVSEDKLYLRRERPKGILRWEVEVPAGSTGEKARILEYGYTVEYDRSFELSTLVDETERLQQEFEELQRGRLLR